jgi:hypothetical protein
MINEDNDFVTVLCNHPIETFEFLKQEIPGFSVDQLPVTYTGYRFYEDGNWLGNPAMFVTFITGVPQAALDALSWIGKRNIPYLELAI